MAEQQLADIEQQIITLTARLRTLHLERNHVQRMLDRPMTEAERVAEVQRRYDANEHVKSIAKAMGLGVRTVYAYAGRARAELGESVKYKRRGRDTYSTKIRLETLAAYEAGESMAALAERYGVSRQAIHQRLERARALRDAENTKPLHDPNG